MPFLLAKGFEPWQGGAQGFHELINKPCHGDNFECFTGVTCPSLNGSSSSVPSQIVTLEGDHDTEFNAVPFPEFQATVPRDWGQQVPRIKNDNDAAQSVCHAPWSALQPDLRNTGGGLRGSLLCMVMRRA